MDEMQKLDPYDKQVDHPKSTAQTQKPRKYNRKALIAIAVLACAIIVALVFVQSQQSQPRRASEVVQKSQPIDRQSARNKTETQLSEAKDAKPKVSKNTPPTKEPENPPLPPVKTTGPTLEPEIAKTTQPFNQTQQPPVQPMQASSKAPKKPDPWAQARMGYKQQVAQQYYQQMFAARMASPVILSRQENGKPTKPSAKKSSEQQQFLARIDAAQKSIMAQQQKAQAGVLGSNTTNVPLVMAQHNPQKPNLFTQGLGTQARVTTAKTLGAGTLVEVTLQTGINSQLPGMVVAMVSKPVYDPQVQTVVIPSGTRLIGQYNDEVKPGQDRVQMVWTLMIFDDGRQVALPQFPAVELTGQSGMNANVDEHWDRVFIGAALSAVFSATGAIVAGPTNQFNNRPSQQAVYGGVTPFQQTGEGIAKRYLDVSPTLTIAPGRVVGMFVTRNLPL